ncbi:MAG: SDR family oxidoreductase [Bacteroidetes bacterium]|nr:SDR family oxidoreductase [Bacteroidota bacterium]
MSKTILITGSSTGIGKATALHFHNQGWNVIATMRSPQNENELTDLDNVLITKLDVLDLDSIDESIQKGIDQFGQIDVLLNNAGYGAFGPLESFPRENIVRQFNTNVIGLLDVTRAILPHYRSRQSGIVINISSIGGKMTFPLGSLYHGTKFAVEGISEALSFEAEQIGVRIKIVEPGMIATDFAGRSFDFQVNPELEEYQELITKLLSVWQNPDMAVQASPPQLVAEVIYEAATDGSSQLRYLAGEDAHQYIAARRSLEDEPFLQNIKKQFQL